jgi:serine phosphatase RsbU (regulator of sigma subunit)
MALKYYQKDLKISEELDDQLGISITLCNIGAVYDYQTNYPMALKYYLESLDLAEKLGDKQGVGITLGNIGNVYAAQLDYPKALEYYINSLKINEEIGDKQGIGISNGSIGGLYTKLGKFKEAEFHLKIAVSICKEIGAQNFEKDYHNYLATLYEKTNRPALAFDHYKSYISLRDTIFSIDNSKKILRTEINHDYEKQKAVEDAKHVKEMEKQEALSKEEKRRQNIILYTVGTGLGLVLVFLFFIYRSNRQKQKANKIITLQKLEVEKQKYLIEEKHREITDSINYAERIQRSFLATKDLLDENLKEYFVFFQPKDVVSGDFYWASKLSNGNFALVTADSTGHGVPGAIMSIANIACLKESVTKGLTAPDEILNETRKLVIEYLKNDGTQEGGKDGMDASLVCFDFQNKKLNYAAANNPVWVVRENKVLEFAPDKMPVGKHDKQNIPFTSFQFDLKKGDIVYTLTDGMPDQFGGPDSDKGGKKFMYKKLKELLISISSDSMEKQKEKLNHAFFTWKGDLEQVDDVCIIGVKI